MFLITLQQVAILLIFILIGYFLRKRNVITDSGKKVLAGLLVNIFAPAYSIMSLSTQLSIENVTQYLVYLLVGLLVTVILIFLVIPVSRLLAKDKFHRNMLNYALAFGNIGYFGYPVVGAVFGPQARAMMILFCLPMSIAISTYGYSILTADTDCVQLKGKVPLSKRLRFLHSPPFIGSMIGIFLGLMPFDMPKFVTDLLTVAGNCQSAPAMLLTGASLASVPLLKLFTSWKPYLVGAIRLLVIPFVFGSVLYLLGIRDMIFMLSVIAVAMPVGMNVVVYPESAGKDGTEGAKMCFLSYVLALGALPLIFTLVECLTII